MLDFFRRLTRSKFLLHALSLSVATIISHAVVFASLPLLSRLYSPRDFGLFALFGIIVGIVSFFATLTQEGTVLIARSRVHALRLLVNVMRTVVLVTVVVAVVVLVTRDAIASLAGETDLSIWLLLVPLDCLFVGWYQSVRVWQIRHAQYRTLARASIVRAVAVSAISVGTGLVAGERAGAGALIVAQIIADFLNFAFCASGLPVRRLGQLAVRGRERVARTARQHRLLVTSWFSSQLLSQAFGYVPVVVITLSFGTTALGLYTFADRCVTAPTQLVAQAVADVFRQRAADLWRRLGRFGELYDRVVGLTAAVGLLPFAIGIVFAPSIFAILFSAEWREAGTIASITLFSGFFYFVNRPAQYAVVIVGAKLYPVVMNLIRLVGEVALAALAMSAVWEFHTYLVAMTALRCGWYCVDLIFTRRFSRGLGAFG